MREITFDEGTANDVLIGLHQSAHNLRDGLFVDRADEPDLLLLAWFEGAVVGYLAAATDPLGGLLVWEHVVVPDFRDRGIGRRLLLEAAQRIPPMSTMTIDPTGEFAISQVASYYTRLGFPAGPEDRFKISARAHEVVDAMGEQLEEETTLETILRRKPTEVVTIDPDAPIIEALTLLTDLNIGSVVVSRDGHTIDGILSEREIIVGVHARGAALVEDRARDHMITDPITAEASTVIAHVMEMVTVRRVRHLPVTEDGKLIGIISVGDLLVFRMHEHDMRRDGLPYRSDR